MKANLKQGFYRLMELPVEVWFQILESLESYVDVCRLACTSKLLNEICTQNPDVWKKHLKILFPLILNRINQSNEIKQNAFWRQKFQQSILNERWIKQTLTDLNGIKEFDSLPIELKNLDIDSLDALSRISQDFKSTPINEIVFDLYQDVNIKECILMWKDFQYQPNVFPFEYGSFIINKSVNAKLTWETVCNRLDDLSSQFKQYYDVNIQTTKPKPFLTGLANWFRSSGFRGNNQNYYSIDNSYIMNVMAKKTGIPISMCMLAHAIARRSVGVNLRPIGFPSHFLLAMDEPIETNDLENNNNTNSNNKAENNNVNNNNNNNNNLNNKKNNSPTTSPKPKNSTKEASMLYYDAFAAKLLTKSDCLQILTPLMIPWIRESCEQTISRESFAVRMLQNTFQSGLPSIHRLWVAKQINFFKGDDVDWLSHYIQALVQAGRKMEASAEIKKHSNSFMHH